MTEQLEGFPLSPAEKRLELMSKIQAKLIDDVDKASKAIDNAVEKHRVAQNLLADCETVIKGLQDILASAVDEEVDMVTGEVGLSPLSP